MPSHLPSDHKQYARPYLATIVKDEYFAVFQGRHRAGIHIKIRVCGMQCGVVQEVFRRNTMGVQDDTRRQYLLSSSNTKLTNLQGGDAQAAGFEEHPNGGSRHALAQSAHHPSRHQNILHPDVV